MFLKILVATLFVLMLLGAFVFAPAPTGKTLGQADRIAEGSRRFRIMTWNIGNGDLEPETRAHREDLPAVAEVILTNDPDAVALQELTGEDQLKLLLTHLKNRYRGYVCNAGSAVGADRVAAILIKDRSAGDLAPRFESVTAGDKFAAAATFRLNKQLPEIVLVSAHADAFSASRRRVFTADLVDWVRHRKVGGQNGGVTFIAGDLNLEVSTRNRNNLFTNDAKHDSESYAYLLKYFRDAGRDAGETSVNDRRIDYIFGPLGTPGNSPESRAEVLRGTAIGRMDHWPLLVEITL
jgi:endonuclease/exonuclease/phosphatase family metal-dependent hydrolase